MPRTTDLATWLETATSRKTTTLLRKVETSENRDQLAAWLATTGWEWARNRRPELAMVFLAADWASLPEAIPLMVHVLADVDADKDVLYVAIHRIKQFALPEELRTQVLGLLAQIRGRIQPTNVASRNTLSVLDASLKHLGVQET